MHSAANVFTRNDSGSSRAANIDRMITTEQMLEDYLRDLRSRGVRKISLDMEGDQGSIRYQYSISIFQSFDGEQSAIIDVLEMGNNPTLREFLTCPDIVKVMFSCHNDMFMAQNVLGCTIAPVRDIAIAQKLLGLPVNLANYLNIDKEKKDSFQRANWLSRPIRPELVEYAINDVLKLLEIEKDLEEKLLERELYGEYLDAAQAVSSRDFKVNHHRQYLAKFPGYSRLRPDKKRLAASVWIFRELLGERLNCPVGYILSKKAMAQIISTPEELLAALERELNRGRKEARRIRMQTIEDLYAQALRSPELPAPPGPRRLRAR